MDEVLPCLSKITDLNLRIALLGVIVAEKFGGMDNEDIVEDCNRHLKNLKKKCESKVLPIGDIIHGVCRHRAILFKYLADRCNIESRLVRSQYRCVHNNDAIAGAHVFNIVKVQNGVTLIMDIFTDTGRKYGVKTWKSSGLPCRIVSKNQHLYIATKDGSENPNMCMGEVILPNDEWIHPGETKQVTIN